MDSINKNQPEENREDLKGKAAIGRIQEMIKSAPSCFFCTASSAGGSDGVRPMSVQKVDDEGALWFLSAADSHKNRELAVDPAVKLFFQGSSHAGFLALTGRGSISTDRQKIRELWEPVLRTWFTEGIDDPRITVIKVVPSEGYYWDNKHGNAVAGIKMRSLCVGRQTVPRWPSCEQDRCAQTESPRSGSALLLIDPAPLEICPNAAARRLTSSSHFSNESRTSDHRPGA